MRNCEPEMEGTPDGHDSVALTKGTTLGRMVWKLKDQLEPPVTIT